MNLPIPLWVATLVQYGAEKLLLRELAQGRITDPLAHHILRSPKIVLVTGPGSCIE